MLKMKYLSENFDLARLALGRWRHDEETLTERLSWFRISSNAVYPFDRDGRLCFLRLSPAEEKSEKELWGELDFLCFLQEKDYPAMRPIPSDGGEMLLTLDTPWGVWYASVFGGVPGKPVEELASSQDVMRRYGEALGQLHMLTRAYDTQDRRSWRDALAWTAAELMRCGAPEGLQDVCREIGRELAQLPMDAYGLVHYDFEPDNVFWDEATQRCHVIDFEDGMQHFFAMDLAQALDELDGQAQEWFLQGYRTVYAGPVHTEQLPLMRRFRDAYACARLLHCLSDVPQEQPGWMPGLCSRLQNRAGELIRTLLGLESEQPV